MSHKFHISNISLNCPINYHFVPFIPYFEVVVSTSSIVRDVFYHCQYVNCLLLKKPQFSVEKCITASIN
jgi:hypothetical protein